MNFDTLETPRLTLSGISPELMRYIFENLPKDEIKRILGHRSEKDYEKEASKHQNGYSSYNRSFKLFLLTDKASNTIIGRCGIHNWNTEHRRAEIGYVMEDEQYKRKGLMTEAMEAILDYGFRHLNLNRIEALVGAGNVPSLRLMEKFNFTKEGLLRQQAYASDKFEDSVMFSKLYHEHI
ncbi:MAG: GNAT family N-acetyltransferase [Saprospiraceae bacterium]|nr:GNAT family N-acetyltransferase [Saprospiraceae bacterium]